MAQQKLRVRARGEALVTDYEAEEAGKRAFVGRKFVEVDGQFGFAPTDDVVEKPVRGEYLRAIKKGDLAAADAETAKLAGVEFEPPAVKTRTGKSGGDA